MVTIATISLEKFLECLKKNFDRIRGYELGHDGSDGLSDCVGYIIGALRLAGINYKDTHGSNCFARYYTANLKMVTSQSQLELGDLVYKAHAPGESGYDLPSRYKDDSDQNDYYHIGAVTSVNPFQITHCSSGGMHTDTSLGKWKYAGWCTYVQRGQAMTPPYIATVVTQKGALNVRSGPGTDYSRIGSVPKGESVIVRMHSSEWDFISYEGIQGYVSNQYLLPVEEIHDDDQPTPTPVDPTEEWTMLRCTDGTTIKLAGKWVVV